MAAATATAAARKRKLRWLCDTSMVLVKSLHRHQNQFNRDIWCNRVLVTYSKKFSWL